MNDDTLRASFEKKERKSQNQKNEETDDKNKGTAQIQTENGTVK